MMTNPIEDSQRWAARVVGFSYLLAMATGIGAEYCRGHLVVANDALETARNIIAHERLWRLGIASNLLCLLSDVALITALYVVLKRINPTLALFALGLRVVETAIDAGATLNSFNVLRFLSGTAYLQAFKAEQLNALARVSVSAYRSGIGVTFVWLGIGSTVFCYLWLRSGYIPRWLAVLGVVGSLLLAAGAFAIIIFPELDDILSLAYMLPLGVFEVTVGFWLLLRPLRSGRVDPPIAVSR